MEKAQWWKNTTMKSIPRVARSSPSLRSSHFVCLPPVTPRLAGISYETSLASSATTATFPYVKE